VSLSLPSEIWIKHRYLVAIFINLIVTFKNTVRFQCVTTPIFEYENIHYCMKTERRGRKVRKRSSDDEDILWSRVPLACCQEARTTFCGSNQKGDGWGVTIH
jgi:hypothetical protein